jgi:molecular chaperone GrpE
METNNEEMKEELQQPDEQKDALQNESAQSANEQEDEMIRTRKELKATIEKLEAERDEMKDKFIRKVAEFDNFKRRTEQEQQNLFRYAGEQLAVKILPVVDDLERSLQHADDTTDIKTFVQGVQMIYDKFAKVLSDQGITKMQTVGTKFDVAFHDALMQMPSVEDAPNTVLQEVLPGYLYKDKVLRHAQVIVSAESEENNAAPADAQDEGNKE